MTEERWPGYTLPMLQPSCEQCSAEGKFIMTIWGLDIRSHKQAWSSISRKCVSAWATDQYGSGELESGTTAPASCSHHTPTSPPSLQQVIEVGVVDMTPATYLTSLPQCIDWLIDWLSEWVQPLTSIAGVQWPRAADVLIEWQMSGRIVSVQWWNEKWSESVIRVSGDWVSVEWVSEWSGPHFLCEKTPNLRLKTLSSLHRLFSWYRTQKLRTESQTRTCVKTASEIVLFGRKLALLSHLGSGEPDDCVGGVLLDTTQRPPRLS